MRILIPPPEILLLLLLLLLLTSTLPPPHLLLEIIRRRMEDVFSRPGTRTWQIPAPIADEAAYRAAVLAAENSCTGSDGERAQAESATTSKVRGGELTMRRERRVPGA